ncbi:MAG TPA: class I SAM-dependent methyltransferase [Streptosporangiaceae bacterium]|nr:class I SAM-dependent methyltransferase [Streptosporangiaceae bacterium]
MPPSAAPSAGSAAVPSAGSPASWSAIACWYDELLTRGSGPHELAVAVTLRLVPDLHGQRVLDLACGQGLAARALAASGAASVTGVDFAPEMIELARGHETARPLRVSYLVDDARSLSSLADQSFDLVTCQLGLMDIPDLDATMKSVSRVLRAGGAFVFVIGHPSFLSPAATTVLGPDGTPARLVGDYLHERFWRSANPEGVRRAGNYHRTLSTYLNALVRNGFTVELTEEPAATGRLAREQPVYRSVPVFFAARAAKT